MGRSGTRSSTVAERLADARRAGAPRIEIRILGHFSVLRDGTEVPPIAFGGRQARRLTRMLATRRGTFVPKDVIAESLWPEGAPRTSFRVIEVLVCRARRALGVSSLIVTGPRGYSFAEDEGCDVDAESFEREVAEGHDRLVESRPAAALERFRSALARWRGDPLPEDLYHDWAEPCRVRLSMRYLQALEGGATAALAVGDVPQAAALAGLAAVREPLRESAQLLLVRALAESDDPASALGVFDRFRVRLADELGLDPSPEAAELHRRILRGEPPTYRPDRGSVPRPQAPMLHPGPVPLHQRLVPEPAPASGWTIDGGEPDSYQATLAYRDESVLAGRITAAVFASDAEGRITYWNPGAERLYGWSRVEAVGRPVAELVAPASQLGEAAPAGRRGRDGESWAGQVVVRRKDGKPVLVYAIDSPMLGDQGDRRGAVTIAQEVVASRHDRERPTGGGSAGEVREPVAARAS